jgi:hypothetical protein
MKRAKLSAIGLCRSAITRQSLRRSAPLLVPDVLAGLRALTDAARSRLQGKSSGDRLGHVVMIKDALGSRMAQIVKAPQKMSHGLLETASAQG